MPLKTPEQYEESLRKMNFKVYMMGEEVKNVVDNPMIRPSMNSVKMSYTLAQDPQYAELMTATSSLTGNKINRFCHLHQSPEDLVKKVKMQRLMGQKTAACFQRCVGMDAINAVDSTTFEMDKKLGTEYHKRFTELPAQDAGGGLDRRRRHDGRQGRPRSQPRQAGRSGPVLPHRREAQGRHRRAGLQGPPDGRHQLPLDPRDAHPDDVEGGRRLRPVLRGAGRRQGHLLHLRAPVLRHPQARRRPVRHGQQGVRRPRGHDDLRRSLRALGKRLHGRRVRVQRRPG